MGRVQSHLWARIAAVGLVGLAGWLWSGVQMPTPVGEVAAPVLLAAPPPPPVASSPEPVARTTRLLEEELKSSTPFFGPDACGVVPAIVDAKVFDRCRNPRAKRDRAVNSPSAKPHEGYRL